MRPVYTGECMPALSPEAREARLKHQTVKVALELPHDVAMRLRREAAKREESLDFFLRSLLDVVARDKLAGAILDDAPPP